MALTDVDDKKDDKQQEQPDYALPLRADLMGSLVKSDPSSPGYLGRIDNIITGMGHVEGKANDLASTPPSPRIPNSRMGSPEAPPTMGGSEPGPAMPPLMGAPPKPQQGWLGKIGNVASKMGNIAGTALFPEIMAVTPGTDLNKRLALNRVEKQGEREEALGIEKEKADTEKQGVEQRPELLEEKGRQEQLSADQKAAEAEKLLQERNAATDARDEKRAQEAQQKLVQLFEQQSERQREQFTQQEKLQGEREAAQDARQQKALDAQAEREKNKEQGLTTTTRSMVEAAPKVLDFVTRIRSLIGEQEKQLGPAAGRWSEFMAGKVGAPNPEFTKLRTDVGLLQTLLMRMHVGSRGGEYIMKHFQDLVDTGKQSPENLLAALDEIERYAQDVANEGKQGTSETGGSNAPPAGAKVRDYTQIK